MTWDAKGTQLHLQVSETANEATLRIALSAQGIQLVSCQGQPQHVGGLQIAIVELDPARVGENEYLRATAGDVMILASMHRDHSPATTTPEAPALLDGTMKLPPWTNDPKYRMFPGGPAIGGDSD